MSHRSLGRTIHSDCCHYGWCRDYEPVMSARPGETVRFSCREASDGQVREESGAEVLASLDGSRANPVTGPLFVEGAEPGDALKITIGDFHASGIGWTGLIPGFGLLADQFPDPHLHIWRYEAAMNAPVAFGKSAKVPLNPFIGMISAAPAAYGHFEAVPPHPFGGNLDVKELHKGTVLYLPVGVHGALLSVGDTHAAQGDGEVCGTAIESAMDVELTVDLVKGGARGSPRATTFGPDPRGLDARGHEVTMGIGPDLMEAAKTALSRMVDLISREQGLSPEDAYMLCSVCGDLKISEIVDAPNWVVSFHFPRMVFD